MLRLRLHSSLAAVALCLAAPVHAQALGSQLDAAEQKLTQDTQRCAPINIGEYQTLLNEAAKNKRRAEKAKKAGAPVDETQVNADLAKASDLFNRAVAAHAQQCARQATGQAQTVIQPQGQTQTTPAPAPATTPAPPGPGAAPEDTGSRLGEAEKKLEEDIKACRPVKADDYQALLDEARRNAKAAEKAVKAGAPIDYQKVVSELSRAMDLLKRAREAESNQQPCPPQPEPTPKTGAMNLDPFARDVLAAHNATRAEYGAPPLNWDPGLALRAGAWAGELAKMGRLEHSPREGRGTARENLAQVPVNYTDTQTFGRWSGEKADFVPGIFPNVCRSGAMCEGVLHISQMIWPTTTAIGCGKAIGQGYQFVVCYYDPGGNKDGKMVGIKPTTILPELDTRVAQPTLPPTEVFKPTTPKVAQGQGPNAYDEYQVAKGQTPKGGVAEISAGLRVDQAWGGEQLTNAIDQLKASTANAPPRRDAALFDLGIYSGGAWATDWFEIGGASQPEVGYQIGDLQVYFTFPEDTGIRLDTGYGDYGYDSNLFVGYDLGAFRIESEVAYKRAEAIDWEPIEDLLFRGSWGDFSGGQVQPYVDTKVEQPKLMTADVKQDPSISRQCTSPYYMGANAASEYETAQLKGDSGMMKAAKADFADAIAEQRQVVADVAEAGEMAKSKPQYEASLLKYMVDSYERLTGEKAPTRLARADADCAPGDTNVEPPQLPKTEVFKPEPEGKVDEPM